MSVKIVLENAKAQLEAQKKKEFDTAYNAKYAELAPDLTAFKNEAQKQYDEAVKALEVAREKSVATKTAEIEEKASAFANSKSSEIDGMISNLQAMIEKTEG